MKEPWHFERLGGWRARRSWVTQSALDVARQGPAWTASLRGYATWLDPQSGKGLQVRWRRRGSRAWDFRVKGIPGKHAFLNWSFVGDGQTSMLGIHATTRELRCTWWLGRGTDGAWSQARHVECVWRMDEGVFCGICGHGRARGCLRCLCVVPTLDARRWSRLPHHGQRMGLWCAKRHEGHGWTFQWTWSPSQLRRPFVVRCDGVGMPERRKVSCHVRNQDSKQRTWRTTSDIKNGMVLNHNNGLWQIVEFLSMSNQAKALRLSWTKLKNIESGKVVDRVQCWTQDRPRAHRDARTSVLVQRR